MSVVLKSAGEHCLTELAGPGGEVREYRLQFLAPSPALAWACLLTRRGEGDKAYVQALDRRGGWSCTCPDWAYRRRPLGQDCKHLEFARELYRVLRLLAAPADAPDAGGATMAPPILVRRAPEVERP